jgi:hypothetical protein
MATMLVMAAFAEGGERNSGRLPLLILMRRAPAPFYCLRAQASQSFVAKTQNLLARRRCRETEEALSGYLVISATQYKGTQPL